MKGKRKQTNRTSNELVVVWNGALDRDRRVPSLVSSLAESGLSPDRTQPESLQCGEAAKLKPSGISPWKSRLRIYEW
jgi:hypothetical protein